MQYDLSRLIDTFSTDSGLQDIFSEYSYKIKQGQETNFYKDLANVLVNYEEIIKSYTIKDILGIGVKDSEFLATEEQTVFYTEYRINYVEVYVNGIKKVADVIENINLPVEKKDFSANNGTTIVFHTPLNEGDKVSIIKKPFMTMNTPSYRREVYIAADGQTVFTPISYQFSNYENEVYKNGLRLVSSEFTSGENIVLNEAASLNNTIEIVSTLTEIEKISYTKSLTTTTQLTRSIPYNPEKAGYIDVYIDGSRFSRNDYEMGDEKDLNIIFKASVSAGKIIELVEYYPVDENIVNLFILRYKIKKILKNNDYFYSVKIYDEKILHYIFYIMKHETIKKFFYLNYKKFIPSYDQIKIEEIPLNSETEKFITASASFTESEDIDSYILPIDANSEKIKVKIKTITGTNKRKIFVEAFMKEFDKLAVIIQDISRLGNIDTIPDEYINYLSQLVGYQKEIDDSFFTFVSFRDFIKNIIEIYRIKGTEYSIELFLNLLGFNPIISEQWFDRRLYYSNNSGDRNDFNFYLTSTKPTEVALGDIGNKKLVNETDITDTKNIYNFNKMIFNGEATAEELLGYDEKWSGETFTYFKTNVVFIESVSQKTEAITGNDTVLIANYLDFLMPIFIDRRATISLPSDDTTKDEAGGLVLSDADISSFDHTLHTYSGYMPVRYSWEDGINNHGRNFRNGNGGIYISGFYIDTALYLNNYDFNYADSNSHQSELNRLGIGNRDIFYIYREILAQSLIKNISEEMNLSSVTYNNNFSYIKGEDLRNSLANGEYKNKIIVRSIDANTDFISINYPSSGVNGLIFSSILTPGTKFELISKNFRNRGVYTVDSSSQSGVYFYIYTVENLPVNVLLGTNNGYIIPYIEDDWEYADFILQRIHDGGLTIENENGVIMEDDYSAV